ncbi:cell wall-binding repeat-containing protein [Peptostreptococcus canis]|uniref:Cell wall-binding repeat-containing protein n=1 Tax=Peptostreptococcus canis TaxID=1159213 RepID=A0ABR6TIZ5_9FIRM|nr:cell wall-binding repeat-containing protein [Peptostreptococcus canis]MBC2575375.1 cell wall-binding repeat-containing protein [Peptostreptococcus canis]MBP1997442.1 putative cell wall-binding protein [Peptostreptococcus canis]
MNKKRINVTRIAGINRYETALKTKYYYLDEIASSKFLVVTSGESFVDALSGGLLASEYNCPLVFVKNNSLNNDFKKGYNPLKIQKVFVVGGKSTISDKTIKDLDISNMERLSGKNRLETAHKVDTEIKNLMASRNPKISAYTDIIAVYDGYNFPDALSAIPFMYQYNRRPNDNYLSLFPNIEKSKNKIEGSAYLIFGGKSSVPEYSYEKTRFDGKNRYETAVLVAKAYKEMINKDIDTIVLVSGKDYADALSSTPLASSKKAAILLTESNNLNAYTKEYLSTNKNIKNVIIVGGESSVSNSIVNELEAIK